MPHYKEGFLLPPDYYRPMHWGVTIGVVLLLWVVLPVLAYNPDLMDPILTDSWEHAADSVHMNVLRAFNILIWLHAIQCILAMQKCRKLGINARTTLRWIGSVAVHGYPALRYLLWPDPQLATAKTH